MQRFDLMYQQPQMPIFVLFVSAGVLFDGAFSLWVSLDTLMAFDNFVMWNVKVKYILKVYSVHYTSRKNTDAKNISFGQNKRVQICPLFLPSTHHSFTFNLGVLYDRKHKVRLSKTVYGIFYFWFRFVFVKAYIFGQQNA